MAPNGEHSSNEPNFELSAPVHDERSLTAPAIADRFGVSRSSFHKAIVSGDLPHFRIGKLVRVRPSNIPQFLVDRWTREVGQDIEWPTGQLVYFLGVPGFVKIGCTADLRDRVRQLQPGSPYPFELLGFAAGGSWAEERAYHKRFHAHRRWGEWFARVPEIDAEIARLSGPCLCGVAR